MKKFGFTLAEVMVALALIGVITSLTIPTFVASNKNRTNSTKVATTVSAVENAFTTMIADEAVQDFTETAFVGNPNIQNLNRFFKITRSARITDFYGAGNNNPFSNITPNIANQVFTTPDIVFEAKNGALIMYSADMVNRNAVGLGGTIEGSVGRLTIDTNGAEGPNTWGRDAFYFRVGSDGLLYPAGSLNFSILEMGNVNNDWNTANSSFICTDRSKGMGCTARLIENNYEVDY